AVAMNADRGAAQPTPQHLGQGVDNRKPSRVEVVRMTLEQAAIKTLSSAALTFRSGATFKVGERLPSGALLLAVDAASGRIVTDRRIIALVDWPGAAKTSTAVPPAVPQGAAGASREASLQGGPSGSSVPTPQPSAQAGDAVAAASRPAQASAQVPLSAAPAPEVAAPATAAQPSAIPAVAPGAIEVVSAQQANIAALQSNGVRFMSGRFVAVGETFPSGEKLLRVLPAQGRIITDRRTIQIKEAQAHD
ncbi:MAG: hypothetical protein N2690_11290, partial [Rhodocyclaceae bacterium]|nr:hypothetical protein [Rhodocyclaceae bacterium]